MWWWRRPEGGRWPIRAGVETRFRHCNFYFKLWGFSPQLMVFSLLLWKFGSVAYSHKADKDETQNTFKMSYTGTVKHAGCWNSFHGCLIYPLRKSMTFSIAMRIIEWMKRPGVMNAWTFGRWDRPRDRVRKMEEGNRWTPGQSQWSWSGQLRI